MLADSVEYRNSKNTQGSRKLISHNGKECVVLNNKALGSRPWKHDAYHIGKLHKLSIPPHYKIRTIIETFMVCCENKMR